MRKQREAMALALLVHMSQKNSFVFSLSGDHGSVYVDQMSKAFDVIDSILRYSREHPLK